MNDATQPKADIVNDALSRLHTSRAKLHVIVVGDGTAERPFCSARDVERFMSEACTTVTAFTANNMPFDAVAVGSAADVAEYDAAHATLDDALAALLVAAGLAA